MLIGNTATPTFLAPVANAEQASALLAQIEKSGDVTLRGAVTWSAPDGQKQVWAVITVDEVFTFFEHVVDKLDFLDMHRCWKLEDLVADKVATEAGTQYELPGAEATDLKTHAF